MLNGSPLMKIFTCGEVRARRSTSLFCPSFLSSPLKRLKEAFRGQTKTGTRVIEATEFICTIGGRLEAVWRPFGGQRSLNRCTGTWVIEATEFIAPHAYLLLPCSPQVPQGHCPLVFNHLCILPPREKSIRCISFKA